MKSKICLSCMFFLSSLFSLQSQEAPSRFDVDLWPHGLPNSNGLDRLPYNAAELNFKPSIRVFLPTNDVATGRAVLACPGGGYKHLAYEHEGEDWAPFFNEQGIALIVLSYRMPNGVDRNVPISDAEEAMRVIRANAAKWNIDRNDVGIMGSSAGGHLASTIATHAVGDCKPDFQILFYPVITMDWAYTHHGSRENLLGKNPTEEDVILYSNDKQVSKDTPRAFIVYSDDDTTTLPLNGINYYLALKRFDVPASLHIYPSGGHGWGIKESFRYRKQMLSDLAGWLSSF